MTEVISEFIELQQLTDEELRLRAIAAYVLRCPDLELIAMEAKRRGSHKLADHIAELERRIQDGAN